MLPDKKTPKQTGSEGNKKGAVSKVFSTLRYRVTEKHRVLIPRITFSV
jgi:hypothetical protein